MSSPVDVRWIRSQAHAAYDEAVLAEERSRQWWRWLLLDSPNFWARQARIWHRIADEWLNIADDIEAAMRRKEEEEDALEVERLEEFGEHDDAQD